jgi:Uma2 family endonuclease
MSTAPASAPLLTDEEFYDLPDPPDGGKLEVVDGRVMVYTPVSGKHGEVQVTIAAALNGFLRGRSDGAVTVETGFVLQRNPDIVRAPAVAVARLDTLEDGQLPEEGFVQGPPLLAIEVVSPNDKQRDILDKVGDYIDHGVERVWVVRSKAGNVVVYHGNGDIRLVPADGTLTSDDAGFATPGFELPVSDIFFS